jgi:hypothetical protein
MLNEPDDEDEKEIAEQVKTLAELSDKDWNEIYQIAVKLYNTGSFGQNQMRCTVYAFLKWLESKEFNIMIEDETNTVWH